MLRTVIVATRCRNLSTASWNAADAQLKALSETQEAQVFAAQGRHAQAVPLLNRAVDICATAMGAESSLTQAAQRRLGRTLYDAGLLPDAEVRAAVALNVAYCCQ
jgi:Tetratricopeptide repeat